MKKILITAITTIAVALGTETVFAAEQASPAQSNAGAGSRAEFTKDPRLDLNDGQERMIYQGITNANKQVAPKDMPMIVGAMVPGSLELKQLPSFITQEVSAVKNLAYVKLQDDKVLLVDPTSRVVQDVITKDEGGLTAQERQPPATTGRRN